jgi:hypothetical protein
VLPKKNVRCKKALKAKFLPQSSKKVKKAVFSCFNFRNTLKKRFFRASKEKRSMQKGLQGKILVSIFKKG